jgi:transposase-like protein
MTKRRTHTEKFKIEVGKKLHEGYWPHAMAASRELKIHDSLLGKWKRAYRDMIGWTKANGETPKPETTITVYPDDQQQNLRIRPEPTYNIDPIVYEHRINELEHELHDAHRKIDVLQNLLMVVGGTLV